MCGCSSGRGVVGELFKKPFAFHIHVTRTVQDATLSVRIAHRRLEIINISFRQQTPGLKPSSNLASRALLMPTGMRRVPIIIDGAIVYRDVPVRTAASAPAPPAAHPPAPPSEPRNQCKRLLPANLIQGLVRPGGETQVV